MRCWWIGHDLTIEIGICGCHDVLDSQEPISDVVAYLWKADMCPWTVSAGFWNVRNGNFERTALLMNVE